MTFGERLKEFIEYKRMNIRTFEMKSGLNNGTVYRVLKNGTSLNGDSIAIIGNRWEELNLNWLMVGRGKMLVDETTTDEKDINELPEIFDSIIKENKSGMQAQLHRADKQIELQNDMITLLKGIIEEQKKTAKQEKIDEQSSSIHE